MSKLTKRGNNYERTDPNYRKALFSTDKPR